MQDLNSTAKSIWIYELYYYPNKSNLVGSEIVFYRGTVNNIDSKTLRNCAVRLKEHQVAAKNPDNTEDKYEYIRKKVHAKGWDFNIRIVHEYKEGDEWNHEASEHWWVLDGARKGHQLQNMKHGDLQDPHFLEQIEDLGIKTEAEFIKDSKQRKEAGLITVNKYAKTVDAYHRLVSMNMKQKAKFEDDAKMAEDLHGHTMVRMAEEIKELEDKKQTLENAVKSLTDKRDKMYDAIKADVHDDYRELLKKMDELRADIEKATGFKKAWEIESAVAYHKDQLQTLFDKFDAIEPQKTALLECYAMAFSEYFQNYTTLDDSIRITHQIELQRLRKIAWKQFYNLESIHKMKVAK